MRLLTHRGQGEYMWLEPEGNAKDNFSDMPPAEGIEWAKKMPEHSTASFGGELTYEGYKDVPVSYLYTEQDRTVLPKLQQVCIDNVEQATGKKVDVQKLDSGHFPFLSRPNDVVRIIRRVAGEQI
jgi:pimeloyl-ACP methyl ester carboxylesterase